MNDEKFLGLTKMQFLVIVVTLQVLGLALSLAYTARTASQSARTAVETKEALCAFKTDLEKRYENSQKFLRLTLPERIEEYGSVLGRVPPETVQASARNQEQTLESLSDLTC